MHTVYREGVRGRKPDYDRMCTMFTFKLPYCEECGAVRVPHGLARLSHMLETAVPRNGFFGKFFMWIASWVEKGLDAFLEPHRIIAFARFCTRIRIGSFDAQPPHNTNTRTLALYEGAEATGVTLRTFIFLGLPLCYVAEKEIRGVCEKIVFDIIPRPKGFVSPSLPWMDDKGILKQKLISAGLPCAEGGVAETFTEACAIFDRVGHAVITKPHEGSRGRHTTLIRDTVELERGFRIAQQIALAVVVEKYLKGTVHRVTLVGGEPVAIARREYPHVFGDGMYTVEELVAIENNAPYRDGVHFQKIDTKHRVVESLRKQNLTLSSVPTLNQKVILNDKNSRLHGTLTEDVTDTVHPENMTLFRQLGTFLADPIVGVDFIISDMSRSWKEQPDAGVIECNSMPFIDVHHRVVSGRQINVAEYLWNEVFK